MMRGREHLQTRTDDELRAMRRAGLVVGRTLGLLEQQCRAGVSTAGLDAFAEETIRALGGSPSFPQVPGYRHTLCVSVNDEVVHGIPGPRLLCDGDLVSIDCGAVVDGWHGDAAVTVVVGGPGAADPADVALCEATRRALWDGIAAFRVGGRVGDIGDAVQDSVAAAGRDRPAGPTEYGIVEGYEGHGIGRAMHLPPGVPNVRLRHRGPRVRSGATVAIEPMVTRGAATTRELEDGWTAVTIDGARASHWEHTVATTRRGLWVLTAVDGGQAELRARGVPYAPVDLFGSP